MAATARDLVAGVEQAQNGCRAARAVHLHETAIARGHVNDVAVGDHVVHGVEGVVRPADGRAAAGAQEQRVNSPLCGSGPGVVARGRDADGAAGDGGRSEQRQIGGRGDVDGQDVAGDDPEATALLRDIRRLAEDRDVANVAVAAQQGPGRTGRRRRRGQPGEGAADPANTALPSVAMASTKPPTCPIGRSSPAAEPVAPRPLITTETTTRILGPR
jgi:hypothetical protein